MSNCANVRLRNSIPLSRYYRLVQEAVKATYGDALKLDCDPANTDIDRSGINVTTDEGTFLCQLFLYSTRRIVVDHRSGEVGYMVSDVLMRYLARKMGGKWTEDCLEKPLDPGPERPLYLLDYIRRVHARILKEDGGRESVMKWINAIRPHYFTGKFARFWSKGTP